MAFIIFKAAVVPRICSSCLRRRGLVTIVQTQTANDFFPPAFLSCCSLLHHYWRHLLIIKGVLFKLFVSLYWSGSGFFDYVTSYFFYNYIMDLKLCFPVVFTKTPALTKEETTRFYGCFCIETQVVSAAWQRSIKINNNNLPFLNAVVIWIKYQMVQDCCSSACVCIHLNALQCQPATIVDNQRGIVQFGIFFPPSFPFLLQPLIAFSSLLFISGWQLFWAEIWKSSVATDLTLHLYPNCLFWQ